MQNCRPRSWPGGASVNRWYWGGRQFPTSCTNTSVPLPLAGETRRVNSFLASNAQAHIIDGSLFVEQRRTAMAMHFPDGLRRIGLGAPGAVRERPDTIDNIRLDRT